jgi:uncharacterized protein with FMN-binding domain
MGLGKRLATGPDPLGGSLAMISRARTAKQWMFLGLLCVLAACAASHPELELGPVDTAGLKDGVYQGESRVGPVTAVVEVTLEHGGIARIDLLKHFHMMGGKADPAIRERILASQSTRVDVVSGATGSSKAIMQAVENALQAARKP